jgi:hypothetical protein
VTVTNAVSRPALTRTAMVVDVVAKVGLVVLLVIAVAYPDLGNIRGKAAGLRAVAYPLGALVVPIVWWLLWRRRPFPWLGDALVTLPWFTHTLGNRLNLFDTVDFFDDWMHFMNWGLLTAMRGGDVEQPALGLANDHGADVLQAVGEHRHMIETDAAFGAAMPTAGSCFAVAAA